MRQSPRKAERSDSSCDSHHGRLSVRIPLATVAPAAPAAAPAEDANAQLVALISQLYPTSYIRIPLATAAPPAEDANAQLVALISQLSAQVGELKKEVSDIKKED